MQLDSFIAVGIGYGCGQKLTMSVWCPLSALLAMTSLRVIDVRAVKGGKVSDKRGRRRIDIRY